MLDKKEMENCNNSANGSIAQNTTNGAGSNPSDDTLYLCNFQVFADGDWLCLKEVDDQDSASSASSEISRQRKPPDSLAITPELDRLEKIYPNYPVGNPKGLFCFTLSLEIFKRNLFVYPYSNWALE